MTHSGKRSRTIRIVLAVVAVFAVIAIAVAGIMISGNKRYNAQVEIADKAFAEGNYQEAEDGYMKAVGMKPRKAKAREGLAYTYAIQEKTEDAVKAYDKLYEDTKEEKYKRASEEVINGRLPMDTEIIPAKGIWRHADERQIPYYQSLTSFISLFNSEYYFWEDGQGFNCSEPGDFPAISIFMTGYGNYYMSADERQSMIENNYENYDEIYENAQIATRMEGTDPKGWAADYELYDYYEVYDVEKTNELIKAVFNISDKDIELMLQQAEKEKLIYAQDGKYYCVAGWPTAAPGRAAEITDMWTDGNRYCIQYGSGNETWDGGEAAIDRGEGYETRYILLDLKTLNGKRYWSIYYDGNEMPDEIITSTKVLDNQGEGSGEDSVFEELEDISFIFTSGAGAWGTEMKISADGSFEGSYHDTNMGETGSNYPNGSVHYCNFKGRFGKPEKVGEYEYRFKLESIETENEEGEEHIEDGVRYIASAPYGMNNAGEMALYMPGAEFETLPVGFKDWVTIKAMDESSYLPTLKFYGLYNIQEQQGFTGETDR